MLKSTSATRFNMNERKQKQIFDEFFNTYNNDGCLKEVLCLCALLCSPDADYFFILYMTSENLFSYIAGVWVFYVDEKKIGIYFFFSVFLGERRRRLKVCGEGRRGAPRSDHRTTTMRLKKSTSSVVTGFCFSTLYMIEWTNSAPIVILRLVCVFHFGDFIQLFIFFISFTFFLYFFFHFTSPLLLLLLLVLFCLCHSMVFARHDFDIDRT